MTSYTISQARERLPRLLDQAEQGQTILIERRGVRFALRAEPSRRARTRRTSLIAWMDPAVRDGDWTWIWGRRGLKFAKRRRKP